MADAGGTGSEWTVDTLREYVAALMTAADVRYLDRFVAQEKAVDLALGRVDKEFHEHLRAAREETSAALDAADKAIAKSEAATERRFESVNEFRAQLSDQASRFMPRAEAVQRADTNAERIVALEARMVENLALLTSRLDLNTGRSTGREDIWGFIVGAVGLVGAAVGILIGTR